jgi:hypothetical protein
VALGQGEGAPAGAPLICTHSGASANIKHCVYVFDQLFVHMQPLCLRIVLQMLPQPCFLYSLAGSYKCAAAMQWKPWGMQSKELQEHILQQLLYSYISYTYR